MTSNSHPVQTQIAADNCEVLSARLAKYEDAEGRPVGLTHDQAELVGLVRDLALRSGKHARPLIHAAALGLEYQAREIERLKRAAQTNWNEFAEDVKDQPKTAAQDECDLPPVGWICTRQRGHSGPCAAVECVDHDTAYDEGPNSDGYVCIKCSAALSAPSHGEQSGVMFGFDDKSVMVSQEAYQIFMDRERAYREATEASHGEQVREWNLSADGLPACGKPVLAYYLNSHGKGRRIRAEYVKAWTVQADDLSDPDTECVEYSEQEDAYYIRQGWYELIDNWDEYGRIAVHEGVITHWQELPAAPSAGSQEQGE